MFNADHAAKLAEEARTLADRDKARTQASVALVFALLDLADAQREATALNERLASMSGAASETMQKVSESLMRRMGFIEDDQEEPNDAA